MRTHYYLVTLQQMDQLEGDGVVDMDEVLDSRHQQMSTVTEQTDLALTHRELLEQLHVINQQVEKPYLVNET